MTAATATRDVPIWIALSSTPHAISYVQVGPWRTRVLQAGTADGEALILMAGTGGHLEAYAHNIPAFAQRYRVIAYDYPGHGYTTPATADLELPGYIDHLAGLIDMLGIGSAHLNGESLGGWVAVKFAAAHPDCTGKLVLNTPGGMMARPEVMERIRSLSQAAADDPTDERIRARLEWLMADPATVTDELVAIRQAIYAQPGFAESMRHPVPAGPGGPPPQPDHRRRARDCPARRPGGMDLQRPLRPGISGHGHGQQDPRRPVPAHHRRRALAPVGTARCLQPARSRVPR